MLGDIASIATLVLFFIYFIGRIITIAIEKNIKYESVYVYFNENQIPKNIKIIDEYKCSDDSKEILIITPTTKSYNNVKIYECEYNEKNNKLEKTKKLCDIGRIYNDNSIRIDTILSCGITRYIIEFERCDYMKVKLISVYNGKNGIQEELLEFKHTFKSIIYYLFR